MRPPLNAGENEHLNSDSDDDSDGFNEAPAKRGGKRDRRRA